MYTLPAPTLMHRLTAAQKAEVLDHLFEPCAALAALLTETVMAQPYASYGAFVELARRFLVAYLHEQERRPPVAPAVATIVLAHPRLGPSRDKLSSHSAAEQRSLAGSAEEAQRLAQLNDFYEATFPGLRYVVFVNGRSREEIMADMEARIARGDILQERRLAFEAMCDIALDRARTLGAKL